MGKQLQHSSSSSSSIRFTSMQLDKELGMSFFLWLRCARGLEVRHVCHLIMVKDFSYVDSIGRLRTPVVATNTESTDMQPHPNSKQRQVQGNMTEP